MQIALTNRKQFVITLSQINVVTMIECLPFK